MPRPVIAALALVALVALPACGGGGSDDGAATDATVPEVTVTSLAPPAGGGDVDPGDTAGDGSGAGADEVTIRTFAFRPGELAVEAGSTVTWTNGDRTLHTVTAGTPDEPGDAFDEELDGAGTTATHRFETPGSFAYFCRRHPSMTGVVTVT